MNSALIRFDREQLLSLERSMDREWLETDGLGGYASSTVLMCPTRRYHALLVEPLRASTERHAFLTRFEETLIGGGKSMPISMARYAGLWSPLGHQCIEAFELGPFPAFTYLYGGARIEREVMMVHGRRATLVRWRVSGQKSKVTLQLKPLLACRRADALTTENFALDHRFDRFEGGISCQPYPELPPVHLSVSGRTAFEADPVWYHGLEYPLDLARGYDGHEDQFSPGFFELGLEDGADVFACMSLDEAVGDPAAMWERESERRRRVADRRSPGPRGVIELGADAFLYRTHEGRLGVIAGFPWFLEWGRDTFISLPGLLLARGRVDECGAALSGALRFLKNGLMPNVFGLDRASSAYDSVDASLWFARCVRLYEQAGAPTLEIVERFLPALREIARAYRDGTALGIRCDEGGLIVAGGPHLNATWMDARIDGVPVTPRDGCAVEIQALWYHLLAFLEHLETAAGSTAAASGWSAAREKAGATYLQRFWLDEERRLADVWRPGPDERGSVDRAVRPNMVIAAALEWSPLSIEQRADVVACARAELLTPFGLRTLGPKDPAYVGRYAGGDAERDRAYHQGTVWPWLLGSHVEACLRAGTVSREELRALLEGFDPHLRVAGVGHVSEIFDGDPPHLPGGTIAQAWSEAELLRAWTMLDESGP